MRTRILFSSGGATEQKLELVVFVNAPNFRHRLMKFLRKYVEIICVEIGCETKPVSALLRLLM